MKTKTTPYHPHSDGLVERFNRTLLAMLAMFVSREHDNWDDLLPFMMLAYNTTVYTTTGFTPYRLVFGEECSLPGNLVHRELRPDPPPGDVGDYASWVRQAHDEVRAQQQRATHRQKRNYDSKAVARAFPIGSWTLRYYPPARKNKLCSPWIGPYKIVHAPMEWVVGIQIDANARIFYAPSTFTPTDIVRSQQTSGSAHQTGSVSTIESDVRASNAYDQSEDIPVETDTVPTSTLDLHDAKCILSMKSDCCMDVNGFRFSQWKGYSTHYNFSLWLIRNTLDSLLNTCVWIM